MFRNSTECKENESQVWEKYSPAPSHIKRTVHETGDPYSRRYTYTVAGYISALISGVIGFGPTLKSTRRLLTRHKPIRLTRFEKYEVLFHVMLLFPVFGWAVSEFLQGNWLFRFLAVMQFGFCVWLTFKRLVILFENRKEQSVCDTDQTHEKRRCSVCITPGLGRAS